MAKINAGLTKEGIQKRWKEGRGQGEGSSYKPWLKVQDVPSKGLETRTPSWKTGRVQHFISNNELNYFYLLEWAIDVTDIREQYPLWPLDETQEIARRLGVSHPTPPGGGLVVMTSDFFITLDNGNKIARTVKQVKDLCNSGVLEKLDIERQYWNRRGIDWGIIVAEDLPMALIDNIKWLHPHFTLDGFGFDSGDIEEFIRYLTGEVITSPESLSSIARRCDDDLSLPAGSCLTLSRHLLATRQWQTDMMVRINPARPLVLLQGRGE